VFDDCCEAVGDDSDMNLYSDGIFRFSPESLDSEMLLDPLEEKLNLPSVFIQQGDFLGFEEEVARVVYKAAMKFGRIIDDSSDDARILFTILLLGKANALVFENVVCSIKDVLSIDNLDVS
jgi:hypothetical protein